MVYSLYLKTLVKCLKSWHSTLSHWKGTKYKYCHQKMLDKTQFLEWERQQDQEKSVVRKVGTKDNKTLNAKGLSPVIHSLKVSKPPQRASPAGSQVFKYMSPGRPFHIETRTTSGEKNDIIIWIMCYITMFSKLKQSFQEGEGMFIRLRKKANFICTWKLTLQDWWGTLPKVIVTLSEGLGGRFLPAQIHKAESWTCQLPTSYAGSPRAAVFLNCYLCWGGLYRNAAGFTPPFLLL